MIYPTTIVDNFFDDPDKIVEYSKKLNYKKDPNNDWPGVRTESLNKINYDFFNTSITKIISILYPMDFKNITFKATQFFQKVNKEDRDVGNKHTDPNLITAIIYLSDHKKCGTSICRMEGVRSDYKESVIIESMYNRLLLFDASQLHAAQKYTDGSSDDRLTLISFIYSLHHENLKYPIPEMRRLLI